ncbi:hypothetical protein V6N13_110684 [Hibiscus sabdariffa]
MGDSSSSRKLDWKKLFAATSSQSLEFFPPEVFGGVPLVSPSSDVFDDGSQAWRFALVGQFIGKAPNFGFMQKLVNNLWGKHGDVEVSSAGDSLFVFRFVNASVRDWVLESGPWHFQNKLLILRCWEPNMSRMDFNLDRIPVWVHLSGVPLELFSQKGLSYIASALGYPLYMDSITASKQRLAYAKVCVEISVDFDLPCSVDVKLQNGNIVSVYVDVPWVPPKCSRCKIFGHSDRSCFVADECEKPMQKLVVPAAEVGRVDGVAPLKLRGNPMLENLSQKVVAVTPLPSVIKSGKGVYRGSSNQFQVLADVANLLHTGTDVVNSTVDTIVVGKVTGSDEVSVDESLDGDVIDGVVDFVVEPEAKLKSIHSPRKTRNASLGVHQLLQDMKVKQKARVEKDSWCSDASGDPMRRLFVKLKRLKPILKQFNRERYGELSFKVVAARKEVEAAQLDILCGASSGSVERVHELKAKLFDLEAAERSF